MSTLSLHSCTRFPESFLETLILNNVNLWNFQVEVVALSSYEEKEEQFKDQVHIYTIYTL